MRLRKKMTSACRVTRPRPPDKYGATQFIRRIAPDVYVVRLTRVAPVYALKWFKGSMLKFSESFPAVFFQAIIVAGHAANNSFGLTLFSISLPTAACATFTS